MIQSPLTSFIFCTSYVDNNQTRHSALRYWKWIEYYAELRKELRSDYIFLIDDGSLDIEKLLNKDVSSFWAGEEPEHLTTCVNIIKFKDNLGRNSVFGYPGWWRSFTYSLTIAQKFKFDKIIHIESDFFVISPKLRTYIGSLEVGWVALFSEYYNFPESAIQIICKSDFDSLGKVFDKCKKLNYNVNHAAELYLPFTSVNKKFNGDRIGEFRVLHHWAKKEDITYDYIGQVQPELRILSQIELSRLTSWLRNQIAQESHDTKKILFDYLKGNNLILEANMESRISHS